MHLKHKFAGILAGTAACLALAATATAQVSADALLDKLVAKGILKEDEAEDLKNESLTNDAGGGLGCIGRRPAYLQQALSVVGSRALG